MQDLTIYRQDDGTYKSPRNGKNYRSEKALRSHLNFRRSENTYKLSRNNGIEDCLYCGKGVSKNNLRKHETACYLNPLNVTECLNCGNPIKDYKNSKGTCSHSCSNSYFREIRNKPEKYTNYTTICWHFHKKQCIICSEYKIVAVHHYNEDHNDNRPENLVPLCPTHHQYIHSQYKDEIIDTVDKYVIDFKKQLGVA